MLVTKKIILCCILSTSIAVGYAQSSSVTWRTLAKGLQYTQITLPATAFTQGTLHAFQIDVADYQLDLAFARDNQQPLASVKQLAQVNDAILAINGGFFTPNSQPLGLRIQHGQQRSTIKSISWWGVFYIRNHRPYIVAQRRFKHDEQVTFALQAGPRLLANGNVLRLKPGAAQRSMVCITTTGKVILAVTQHTLISTTDLAKLSRQSNQQGGLGCQDALNLDGGSSTQLYANVGNFVLDLSGFDRVADAIIIKTKQ